MSGTDHLQSQLKPQMLKPAATDALLELLKPIQEEFQKSEDWKEVELKAYPPPVIKKKEKKVKNRGTRFPGAMEKVEVKPDGHVEGDNKGQVELATGSEEAMKKLDITTIGAT